MLKKNYINIQFVFFLFLTTFMSVDSDAQEHESENSNTIKIGIIEQGDNDTVKKLADLLYAACSAYKEIALLERSEQQTIEDEKALSLSLSSPGKRLLLGETLGADFLIIIDYQEEIAENNERYDVRAVDCRTGAVVHRTHLPVEVQNIDSLADATVEITIKKIEWLHSTEVGKLVAASVPDLTCLAPDALSDVKLVERIRRSLIAYLSSIPTIICLEREELQKAKQEVKYFEGEALKFWNSSVIINGTAGLQGENRNELYLHVNMHTPKGEVSIAPETGRTKNFPKILTKVSSHIAHAIDTKENSLQSDSFNSQQEVKYLMSIADIYISKNKYDKAQKICETALALQNKPPDKFQCFKMASILQQLKGHQNTSYPPPTESTVYFEQLEKYIYMFENYILPYDYSYYPGKIVRVNINRYIRNPPRKIATIIKNNKTVFDATLKRQINRLNYFTRLWKQYDKPWNSIKPSRSALLTDNMDVLLDKYEKHWYEVIRQVCNPTRQDKENFEGYVFFNTARRKRVTRFGDPLSKNESERTFFANYICDTHLGMGNDPDATYRYDYEKMRDNMKRINTKIMVKLTNELNLSEVAKAIIFVQYGSYQNGNIYHYGSLKLVASEVKNHVQTIINFINEPNMNHWIFKSIINKSNEKQYPWEKVIADGLWQALISAPEEEQILTFETFFKPLIKKYPKTYFSNPYHLSELYWKRLSNEKKILTQSEQHILLNWLLFYKSTDHYYNSSYVNSLWKLNLEESYPKLVEELNDKVTANHSSDTLIPITETVHWQKVEPTSKVSSLLSNLNNNVPIAWNVNDNILWLIYGGQRNGGQRKNAILSINLETKKITNAKKSYIGSKKRTGDTWSFTTDFFVLGLNYKSSNLYEVPHYDTCAIVNTTDNGKLLSVESLNIALKDAKPIEGVSGITMNNARYTKGISALCIMDSFVYYATGNETYAWNYKNNEIRLLASNNITSNESPLNGGLAYGIYSMKSDVARDRILFLVRESKPGSTWKFHDRVGERSGLWAYYPKSHTWEHITKFSFTGSDIPSFLSINMIDSKFVFNSPHFWGHYNYIDNNIKFNTNVAYGDVGGNWKFSQPFSKVININKSSNSQVYRLAHPHENARIVYNIKLKQKKVIAYWIHNDKIIQKVIFSNLLLLRDQKWPRKLISYFKLIPIPGGAIIWYSRENEIGEKEPVFVFWEVNPERDGKEVIYNLD